MALEGERLAVTYLAEVTQQTGEDCPAVELVLSTTRRGPHQTLPELDPWYIGRSMAAAAAVPQPGAPVPIADLEEAPMLAAEAGEAGTGVAYRAARPLAVPADGRQHHTMIAWFALDAALDYLAVPVLAPEAYLRAAVTNASPLLLPGPARVFHDTQFVGETSLETVAAGEEFELQLGVDDQIRVERELRRRSTSKAVIGGTRTIDIAYEITVENHRPEPGPGKAFTTTSRCPQTATSKCGCARPARTPAEQNDLGELSWGLSLDGGQTATIRHRFTSSIPHR
ncbi:MAG: DUF4139 domain-containing protein [Streptosporangiaceae bacterium]